MKYNGYLDVIFITPNNGKLNHIPSNFFVLFFVVVFLGFDTDNNRVLFSISMFTNFCCFMALVMK